MPRAAWWGGFYERLVRSVKNHLKRTLGRARLTHEELETVLAEVEAVINSRPITFIYSKPAEGSILTPAHFLVGKRLTTLPDGAITAVQAGRDELTRRFEFRTKLINGFWSRWKREYLLQLKSAHTVNQPKKVQFVSVGDVVLLGEEKLPRQQWKTARVQELVQGRDGRCRSVILKTPNGNVLRSAVQQLYPLEIV